MAAGNVKPGEIDGPVAMVDIGGNTGRSAAALGVVLLDPTTGAAYVAGGGGGGGGSDASAANQVAGNASLASIDGKVATQTTLAALNAKTPALGAAASVASVPVVLATNDAQIGTKTTAVAALGAGGAGLIGWLSQMWERLNNLVGQLPTALGATTPALSLPITQPNDTIVTGPAAQSALNADLLTGTVNGWYDAQNFRSVAVQIVGSAGISAGQVVFESTNDTGLAPVVQPYSEFTSSGAQVALATSIAASASRLFNVSLTARYFRVRISTAFTGGTVQAVASLSQAPLTVTALQAVLSGSTSSIGTVNAQGAAVEDVATTTAPVIVGGAVKTANLTTLVAGDAARHFMTTGGQLLVKDGGLPEQDFQSSGVFTSTVGNQVVKAALAAGLRHYVKALQIQNNGASAVGLQFNDGASTIMWQGKLPANMALPLCINFDTPLRGTAATAVQIVTDTASQSIVLNFQGYAAP